MSSTRRRRRFTDPDPPPMKKALRMRRGPGLVYLHDSVAGGLLPGVLRRPLAIRVHGDARRRTWHAVCVHRSSTTPRRAPRLRYRRASSGALHAQWWSFATATLTAVRSWRLGRMPAGAPVPDPHRYRCVCRATVSRPEVLMVTRRLGYPLEGTTPQVSRLAPQFPRAKPTRGQEP